MEPYSKLYGDRTEECQSSESGWTMYIGSSMDDDDGGGGGVCDSGGGKKKDVVKDEDEDTDDSMTSDASSGPSYLHMQQDYETDGKHNQESNKGSSKKQNKKAARKMKLVDQESRKKENSLVNEKRGVIATVQSGNRAWFLGKRK